MRGRGRRSTLVRHLTTQAILVLVLLVVTVGLLVTQVLRAEVVGLGLVAVLGLTGILPPQDALSGFSSPATLTVVAMLVVSAGLERSGVVDVIGSLLSRTHRGGASRLLMLIMLPTAAVSAFMNNTPVVAMMIPVALAIARRFGMSPSQLLLPVSYAAILGGTCTLIGTSTNLLVDGLYRQAGGPGFGMFEFSVLGLIYTVIGVAFVAVAAPRLLPHRAGLTELLSASAPDHYTTEIVVRAPSRLVGRTLVDTFGRSEGVQILELVRGETVLVGPPADTVIQDGDALLVESDARALHALLAQRGIEHSTVVADEERVLIQRVDLRVAEMVVTPNSSFSGRMVRDLGLSRRHGVQVLGIRRLGRQHRALLRDWHLRPGDVLLVQGETTPLRRLQEDGDVLLIEGIERRLTFPKSAPVAITVVLGVVALTTAGMRIEFVALAGIAILLATRALEVRHAVRAVDTGVLMLLAGTIPLGLAMERSGLAQALAGAAIEVAGPFGPWAVIATLYLLTSVITEVVSNNATAVLLTPIALDIAHRTGIDPKPLLVAVMFGASASFATPIGYQTNTLVMGPGGYTVRDYLRIGLPMNLTMAAAAAVLIPLLWPPVPR